MSSNSPPLDYQKPVKVKSRWTQSCQMEMLMEESQSSLDMSDTITDVSTSDLNESTDYSSELNSKELRRSRRTSNKTDYRQLNGLKKIQKKKFITSNLSNKRGRKRKQPLNTPNIDKENKLKNNVSQESTDLIKYPLIDWNNIICQLERKSKSVNNMTIVPEQLPSRPIRRASLSWKFTFTPKSEVKNSVLDKEIDCNFSNTIKHLNFNETLIKVKSLSTNTRQFDIDNKSINTENNTQTNISSQSYNPEINNLNCTIVEEQNNKILNNINEVTITNFNKEKQFKKHITNVNQYENEKPYKTNHMIVSDSPSKMSNFKCLSIYQFKKIRSKSLDLSTKKTDICLVRSKSYDNVNSANEVNTSVIDTFRLQKCQKKSPKKNRRQSKRIKPKNNYLEMLDDLNVPEVNYDQVADDIYREHKKQLHEVRMNDLEFDQKLKSTNFTLIKENMYRPNRQTLKLCTPSEMSVLRKLKQRVISGDINDYCECTLSKEDIIEGNTGCDDRCLNRLLKVECGLGCSLKHYCTNKQFQNKQFKKTNIIKTENKGYGICAVEDIPKGVLINEYIGEVINHNEMCNRLEKKEYANLNYMVQLNPDEIIDSTSKGNLTRFINHSCDPNAVGEKWHVLGQSRIGFFSTRHIKKGEEITFDYSFQMFGDGDQICYCGSSNCRGYINKKTQITDLSNSDNSDGIENHFTSKPEEKDKKKKFVKKKDFNNTNKLRELSRELTEIVKLKTGLKVDQELATLNLNRLMVHVTDSVSRLQVLTFIREHDMNKRLFMDFSGLSIIHNWMTSNENESFKLMILEILAELPITNRNTITKSKVLDVVAEWAEIPEDIKTKIESLEYPITELQKHCHVIDSIYNDDNTVNMLVEKARGLWKKWIVLKTVFKIPKKIDQPKPNEKINSNKLVEDNCKSTIDMTPTFDQKPSSRVSNKHINRVRNQNVVSLERIKLRKEFELKVEHEQQKMFRKKGMDNWTEQRDEIFKKNIDYNCLQNQSILNFFNCDNNSVSNQNGVIRQKLDCSSQMLSINQNINTNYNMQLPYTNFIPSQCFYTEPQIFSNYHQENRPILFNTPPPSLHHILTEPQNSTILYDTSNHQSIEPPDLSPTKRLLKLADTNVFNLINESLAKHNNSKKYNTETEQSNEPCSKTVQSGADLLARIKVISDSFKKQPSKLINIEYLKQKNVNTKLENVPISDTILKSICDENNKIIFINEQTGVMSNTLSENLITTPKTVLLSGKNQFAEAIFNSLLKKTELKKEKLVPQKFVLKNLNPNLITLVETEKEIELYKNMRPKILKKEVARIKTKNGFVSVMKRQWGTNLKGINSNHNKVPATKRNLMRKGNIHSLALKNCLINTTKSALKKNNINMNDYLKRPKEKRVTFWIEGETSPTFPHSEIRPINLNQNSVKQKPLMKCHPFEIRNKPKSILQPSTSTSQSDNIQFPFLEQSFETNNDQIIRPIVAKFKASRNRRFNLCDNSTDLEQLLSQRKHMIPVSMKSLSIDVIRLIPDNKKEMKKVVDYYHSMATIIVKILGSYAKKTCQQGRIRSDEDFKYLAKKINENVLLKELQLKKVDKLKISNNTKDKVTEYIKKYMSRFGEIYKRKT